MGVIHFAAKAAAHQVMLSSSGEFVVLWKGLERSAKQARRRLLKVLVKGYASALLRQSPWDGRAVISPCGRYGTGEGPALPLVLLGDSSAVTVGVSAR
ncbi:hypothetical protein, partial [Streptomyces cinereoruber]|uniref:hypothetical protein n=1 Tax=Streptomyces cinereoruber TaxID=67260 RepID=UPI003637B597